MMKWISVKEKSPTEYKYYLVSSQCEKCLENEDHMHRMVYVGPTYAIAKWDRSDEPLVEWKRARGDHSWDEAAVDHWSENGMDVKRITHWMAFPQSVEDFK